MGPPIADGACGGYGALVDAVYCAQCLLMGTKLSLQDASAYEAIDRLLWREWDPIGVSDLWDAQNEYRGYLPSFWVLLTKGDEEETLVSYLRKVEIEHIACETSDEHKRAVVRKAKALLEVWRMPVP